MKTGYLYTSTLKCTGCDLSLYLFHSNLGGRIKVCRSCNPRGFQMLAKLAKNIDFNETDPINAKTK